MLTDVNSENTLWVNTEYSSARKKRFENKQTQLGIPKNLHVQVRALSLHHLTLSSLLRFFIKHLSLHHNPSHHKHLSPDISKHLNISIHLLTVNSKIIIPLGSWYLNPALHSSSLPSFQEAHPNRQHRFSSNSTLTQTQWNRQSISQALTTPRSKIRSPE